MQNTHEMLVSLFGAALLGTMSCSGDTPADFDAADNGTDSTGQGGDSDGDGDTDGDGDSDGDADGDGDSDTICGEVTVSFDPVIPTVVLLIDQSGSMRKLFGIDTRWNVLRQSLLDPSEGIIKELQDLVRFGLTLYTSQNGSLGGECPLLTQVAPATANYQKIADVYNAAEPVSDTPTGESLREVAKDLSKLQKPGPKIIVLATDGEPDTCARPSPDEGQAESVAAAGEAFDLGITTYVVSVSNEIALQHLQELANAGQGHGPGDPLAAYYLAMNPESLVAAFEKIIWGTRECTLALKGEVDKGMESKCKVTVGGEPIEMLDPDGWRLNNPSEIELLGSACEAIQKAIIEVEVKCPCEVFVPL